MTDFSHLKGLEVSADNTAKYTIHQIMVNGKTPTLIVAPATEANKPYFNALLKSTGKNARTIRAGIMNTGMLDENRKEDRELYPSHIVKGWDDMLDAGGKEIKFSMNEVVSFLSELPDWLFDDIRNFCGNPANFTELVNLEISSKN